MLALFDSECNHVGWLKLDEHIFDTGMSWVAYLRNGHAWSAQTGDWLGPIRGATCLDRNGRPVAWCAGQGVASIIKPITPVKAVKAVKPVKPVRPVTPIRPIKPVTPMGGWSKLTFEAWRAQ